MHTIELGFPISLSLAQILRTLNLEETTHALQNWVTDRSPGSNTIMDKLC
jgi:hypothetical protein